jgi:hypothetical protein
MFTILQFNDVDIKTIQEFRNTNKKGTGILGLFK